MKRRRKEAGFSLIEALVVIAIILILAGAAIVQIGPSLQRSKAETALETTLGQLRLAHQTAIDQRKILMVTFTAPRTISIAQVTIDATTGLQTTVPISSIDLPSETQFTVVSGVPTQNGKTPDGLGTASNAIDFGLDYGGGQTTVYFQRDGRATDSAGRLNDGVVYISIPGDLNSSRAVTVLGATGRVKGWQILSANSNTEWRPL